MGVFSMFYLTIFLEYQTYNHIAFETSIVAMNRMDDYAHYLLFSWCHLYFQGCPPNFIYSSDTGTCYLFSYQRLDQMESAKKCETYHADAHLLAIETKVEFQFIQGMLQGTGIIIMIIP